MEEQRREKGKGDEGRTREGREEKIDEKVRGHGDEERERKRRAWAEIEDKKIK